MTQKLLRRDEARRKLGGISDSAFYLWVSQGRLPRPVHLGRTSFWVEAELDEVIEALKAERAPEMSEPAA